MVCNETKSRKAFFSKLIGLSSLIYILLEISTLSPAGQGLGWIPLTFAFGIIVLSSWLVSWKILVYVLPGVLLYFIQHPNSSATISNLTLSTAFTSITAPFAIYMMKWAGISLDPSQPGGARIWKALLLAGIKASVFSYLMVGTLPLLGLQQDKIYEYSLGFIIGAQAAGLFTVLFAMTVSMKFLGPHKPH